MDDFAEAFECLCEAKLPYDTLDDVDWLDSVTTLREFSDRIFGNNIKSQALIVGDVSCGSGSIPSLGNCEDWGIAFFSMQGHEERWYVRSDPKGNIGKPIKPGETRRVAILTRCGPTGYHVATIRMWELEPVPAWLIPETPTERQELQRRVATGRYTRVTHSAENVSMFPIQLFETDTTEINRHANGLEVEPGRIVSHHQVVLGQYADLHPEEPCDIGLVVYSNLAEYQIAGSLSNAHIVSTSDRLPTIVPYKMRQWQEIVTRHDATLKHKLVSAGHKDPYIAERYLRAARRICDTHNYMGVLDMIADPFYAGALPDDIMSPLGVRLIMAVAVRVAAHPERIQVPTGTINDQYSAKEFTALFESVEPPIPLPSKSTSGHMYRIDALISHMIDGVAATYNTQLNNPALERHLRPLKIMIDHNATTLYRIGTGLCIDVCSTPPPEDDDALQTDFGYASRCVDPVLRDRDRACWAAYKELGRVHSSNSPQRKTSRNARQQKLIEVMTFVERTLAGSTRSAYHIADMNPVPTFVDHPDKCKPSSKTSSSPSVVHASATAPAASGSDARTRPGRSAKKIKGQNRRKAQTQQEAGSSRCVFNLKDSKVIKEDIFTFSSTKLQFALQMGMFASFAHLHNYDIFTISATTVRKCCTCYRSVHVVEAFAIGGIFSKCMCCGASRCLHCVDANIQAIQNGNSWEDAFCSKCLSKDA